MKYVGYYNGELGALEEMIDTLSEMGFHFSRITEKTKPVIMSYRDF